MDELTGSYDPVRRPWVVRVYRVTANLDEELVATYTPEAPGPLTGEWSLTLGPLGESRYGELKVRERPGWETDLTRIRIWEQPDPTQPPDFWGVVGQMGGMRQAEHAEYSVPLQGFYDLIREAPMDDVYFARSVLRAGVAPLDVRRGETVDEHHQRVLAPFPDGSVGFRPDGVLLIGRPVPYEPDPQAGTAVGPPVRPVTLEAGDAMELEDGMTERQEVVTDIVATAGPRWAARRLSRNIPSGRRKLVTITDDRMKAPKVDMLAPIISVQLFRAGWKWPPEDLAASQQVPPAWSITTQWSLPDAQVIKSNEAPTQAEVPVVTIRARVELPLSDIVRGSANYEQAVNALYDLHALTTAMEFSGTANGVVLALPAVYDLLGESLYNFGQVGIRQWLSVGNQTWEQAPLSQRIGSWTYVLQQQDAVNHAKINASIPEEYLKDVFRSVGNGNYSYVLEAIFTYPAAYRWGRRRANVSEQDVPEEYIRYYQAGIALAQVRPPTMSVDALVDGIPTELLPNGWESTGSSAPTAQGRYPGIVRPPARVRGLSGGLLPITELRYERLFGQLSTAWQAGARATQRLSAAEEAQRLSKAGKV